MGVSCLVKFAQLFQQPHSNASAKGSNIGDSDAL